MEINDENINPLFFDIWPVAIGRFAVRFINRSESASITILNALAPPAANVPPSKLQKVTEMLGIPSLAINKAGTVVTSNSSTTRSFIKPI